MRTAILADLRATAGTPDGALRRVAKRHGVSDSTIRRVRDMAPPEAGVSVEQSRAKMKNAIAAKVGTLAERRAAISERLIRKAEEFLDDLDSPVVVYNFGGKDNTFNSHEVPRPPEADRQRLATMIAIFIEKHKLLDQYDSDVARGSAFDQWLATMSGRANGPKAG